MRSKAGSDSAKLISFIEANLHLVDVPSLSGIRLYAAHSGSRLGDIAPLLKGPPYWAYQWAGGAVLARYLFDHPESVAGKHVVDLGTGSGLLAIVAAKLGAVDVQAIDVDPHAIAAARLNALENAVVLKTTVADVLDEPVLPADLILVGDLFYDAELANRVLPFLQRCQANGSAILVGDIGRAHLPLMALSEVASYQVPDFGTGLEVAKASKVFTLK